MQRLRHYAWFISPLVVLVFLGASTYPAVARAGLISTQAIVEAEQAQQERARVHRLLARDDIAGYLAAQGVDPAQARARVDSLTDAEVRALAARLDELPAGGVGLLEVALIGFIVIVITDALGYTDVLPFIKGPKKK
ncbi:MAG: DUF6627 family protein [Acidiferrobacterales bacterium]